MFAISVNMIYVGSHSVPCGIFTITHSLMTESPFRQKTTLSHSKQLNLEATTIQGFGNWRSVVFYSKLSYIPMCCKVSMVVKKISVSMSFDMSFMGYTLPSLESACNILMKMYSTHNTK